MFPSVILGKTNSVKAYCTNGLIFHRFKTSLAKIKADRSSFKSWVPQPSPCLPEGKIKERGEEVSDSLLLRSSDEERGYFSDTDDLWDNFYAEVALMNYNKIHHTDYEVMDYQLAGVNHIFRPNLYSDLSVVHVQFVGKSIEAPYCHSSYKLFFAELLRHCTADDHIVTSCHLLDGPTTGCQVCDSTHFITRARSPSFGEESVESDSWTPKAALAYYNLNNNEDYELVGDSDVYFSIEDEFVAHCNFRAKRKTACDSEAELFFAEKQQVDGGNWIVTACCIIDGCKTTAGCYLCIGRRGKRIQHPMGGFRHGLTPTRRHGSS